jgi:hypothetical protein
MSTQLIKFNTDDNLTLTARLFLLIGGTAHAVETACTEEARRGVYSFTQTDAENLFEVHIYESGNLQGVLFVDTRTAASEYWCVEQRVDLDIAEDAQNASTIVTSGTGITVQPSDFVLVVNERYLKSWVKELAPANRKDKGITQADLTAAEAYAWRILLSRFAGAYDTSGWRNAPPTPLFEIWDLMASAYVVRLFGHRVLTNTDKVAKEYQEWLEKAGEMIADVIDPVKESDRLYLLDADGAIIHKRSNQAFPLVRNTRGVTFFSTSQNSYDAFGNHHGEQSIESFVRNSLRTKQ